MRELVTTGLSARRAVCRRCEHAETSGSRLRCALLSGAPVGPLLVSGTEFCPERRHAAVGLTISGAEIRTLADHAPIRRESAWRRVQIGMYWWITYILRRCPAPREIVRFRRSQCATCDRRGSLAGIATCRACGCATRAKTAIAAQACPIGRWAALPEVACRRLDTVPLIGQLFRKQERKCGGCNARP